MHSKIAAISALVAAVKAQQVCTLTTETKPSLSWSTCTSAGSCTSTTAPVVIDANWRWVHDTEGYLNCYTGNTWNATYCPDNESCAENCCLDGADYSSTYGISASGDALSLGFVTQNSNGANIGSRTYLMASNTEYQMFDLLGKEFTFDVDVSNLPVCHTRPPAVLCTKRLTKNNSSAVSTGPCTSSPWMPMAACPSTTETRLALNTALATATASARVI